MFARRVLRPFGLICCLTVLWFVASERPGMARPNYKKCFDTVYKQLAKENKTNCNICHLQNDKKRLNHYGLAVGKELGEKNVKDDDKIIAAIKAVAKKKCKSGEWGERLEKGLIPCDCGDADHGLESVRQRHPTSKED